MRRNLSSFALATASLACFLLLAACNTGGPRLRYLIISPSGTTTISATTTQQFTATAFYSNGTSQPVSATWMSSATSVAMIDNNGVATAIAFGTTTITAAFSGVTAPGVSLAVNQLLSITVTPATVTIAAPQTQQYTAMGTFKNPDGSTAAPTDITSLVDSANGWNSSNTSVATIDNTGLATAVASGSTMITAALYGVTSTPPASLTVGGAVALSLVVSPAAPISIAVGNALTFTVQEKWSDGSFRNPPAGAVITWSSDTPASAAILANSGIAAGFAKGTPKITANETSPATLTGSTTLTVVQGTAHYAYVANNGDSTIQWYTVTAGTTPYLKSAGTIGVGTVLQSFLHPDGQYLYAIDDLSDVFVLDIAPSSSIAPLPGTPAVAPIAQPQAKAGVGNSTNFGAIDPYGRFLYVVDGTSNTIFGYTINPADGSLTLIPGTGAAFTTNLNGPVSMVMDHSGSYLYVINAGTTGAGSNTVSAYMIHQVSDGSGALGALAPLTAQPTIPTGTVPQYAALDPSGTYLYVANNTTSPASATSNSVSAYSIGAGGVLTQLASSPYSISGATSVINVAVDPSGAYLYVLDAGNGLVFSYNIGAGGAIGAVNGALAATGSGPTGISVDPTGVLIAVDNNLDGPPGTISLIGIGGSGPGTVSDLTPSTVNAGNSPYFVIFYNAP